jgi:mono/diheme cytochrome c family protein
LKKLLWITVALAFCWTPAVAAQEAAEAIDYIEFQELLDTRCGACHTRGRIEAAMAQGRAFQPIQEQMAKLGVTLSARERDVMGVFWTESAAQPTTPAPQGKQDDPLAEYRAVLQARCTGCHDLERVEQAMRDNRSFETLSEMMLKRGAVLSEADRKVLGVFWGKPLR